MIRPREFLPRDFFALAADGDDEAIVGRGPNIPLRDRAARLAERRLRLGAPVGRNRPNQPGDVAAVESLLRQTGDLGSRPNSEPTGLFGVPLDDATRRFQRRNGLAVDGVVKPDGETIRALEDESFGGENGAARRREAECLQNRVDRGNKQIQIDEASEEYQAASAKVVALSEEADRLNSDNGLQLVITAISAGLSAIPAIRAGRGIVAVLREFARGAAPDAPAIADAQRDASDLASRLEKAVQIYEFWFQELQRRQDQMGDLEQKRSALGCG